MSPQGKVLWQQWTAEQRLAELTNAIRQIRPRKADDFNVHRPRCLPSTSGLLNTTGLSFPEMLGIAGLETHALCDCGRVITTGRVITVGRPSKVADNILLSSTVLPLCDSCADAFDEEERRWEGWQF